MNARFLHRLMLLACAVVCILSAVPAIAASATAEPITSSNIGDHDYVNYDRWAAPVSSHLTANPDGTFTRVEYTGEVVAVEIYDSALNFLSGTTVDMELPLFGGFYYGETCNFFVFGQENLSEDDSVEVIRIVSYTKDFQRIGSASLYGANTIKPFRAGSLRFAEYGGYLYIRTAHEMYADSNGVNHQANLMINLRIADMQIADSFYEVMNNNYGYVSHSFNQFIQIDGTDIVAVDHGDAIPRSILLTRYNAPAGQDSFMQSELVSVGDGRYRYVYVKYVEVLPIGGSYGANDTGVSLGGFEVSTSAYLIAGNTVSHGDDYDASGQRNIFISVTQKDNFTAEGTTIQYLTSYAEGDNVTVSNPHFMDIGDDRFIILWTESGSDTSGLRYAFVDGNGELIGQIYTGAGVLSDCQPIVANGKLIWYVTSASAPAFLTIDLNAPDQVTHDHVYSYAYLSYPSYKREGALSAVCAVCGEAGANVVIPAILNKDEYTLTKYITEPTCTTDGSAYFRWNDVEKYGVIAYGFSAPVAALGHRYEYTFVDSAHTLTCSGCGDVQTVDGANEFKFRSCSLALGSDISIVYKASVDACFTDVYVNFSVTDAEGNVYNSVVTDYTIDSSNGRYVFVYEGINPQLMGDTVVATLTGTLNGQKLTFVHEYSVLSYCQKQLDKATATAEYKTMISDMLVYGAKAQVLKSYDTDNLVTNRVTGLTPSTFPGSAEITNGQVVGSEVEKNTVHDVAVASLALSNKVSINFGVYMDDPSLYTVQVTVAGEVLTIDVADMTYNEDNNRYYFTVDMLATEFDTSATVVILQDGVQVSRSLSYTVNTYIKKNCDKGDAMADVLQALYNFGKSSENYVNSL